MKYIITESQLNLISELERDWRDFEYEDQYNKFKGKIVPYIVNKIHSYNDEDNIIDLYDSDGEIIIRFIPYNRNGSLYYNRDFDKNLEKLFPHPIWMIHGKYIMSDVFNHFYPEYNVMSSQSSVM